MYFFPEAAAQAAIAAGMRAALGMIVVDFPSPYAAEPLDYLSKGMAVRDSCAMSRCSRSASRRTRPTR